MIPCRKTRNRIQNSSDQRPIFRQALFALDPQPPQSGRSAFSGFGCRLKWNYAAPGGRNSPGILGRRARASTFPGASPRISRRRTESCSGIHAPTVKGTAAPVIADSTPLSISDPKTQETGKPHPVLFSLSLRASAAYGSGSVAEKVRLAVYSTAAILALSRHMDGPTPHRRNPGRRRTLQPRQRSTPRKIWSSSMSNYAARITNIHNISVYS